MKNLLLFIATIVFISTSFAQDSLYKLGPNSQRKIGVPQGMVTKHEWESKLYNNFRE